MKACQYGFINKDKFSLAFAIPIDLSCVNLLFSHLLGDSHQVHTAITVERLMVFYFNAYNTLQVNMLQVIGVKERWPGDLLPETL